jgi:hypothetical protein
MTTFIERNSMIGRAWKIAETDYLDSGERIAIARFNEVYEAYKDDLDPEFQGISFIAWARAMKDIPEGQLTLDKCFDIVHALLISGKFGQVDWKI